MAKMTKTQAMRVLDARKITYRVHSFPDTIHDAMLVAETVGVPASQVFKTLVVLREDDPRVHPLLVMIPADHSLDLRELARHLDVKSLRMATHDQAEKLTGLKVGGISALALLNKHFSVYIEQSALNYEEILVSAGQRGINLQLAVKDLMAVVGAQIVRGTKTKE